MRRVFQSTKVKGEEHLESVNREDFFYNVCDDSYCDRKLNTIVRESTDGERESLDSLLMRVSTNAKEDRIGWEEFLSYFSTRGRLRPGEELIFSGKSIEEIETFRA